MVDLRWSDESLAVLELAKQIGTDVLSPLARDAEQAGDVPARAWRAVHEAGLLSGVAEDRGGSGELTAVEHVLAVEGLAYGDAGIAMGAAWSGAVALLVARHAGAAHDDLLRRLVDDPDARAGLALYEGYGRDLDELETLVEVRGDQVTVRGTKVAVAHADRALATVVVGRDAGSGRLRAVLVPAGTAGVHISDSRRGLALDASRLAAVTYDVAVPVDHLLGAGDDDGSALAASLERVRLLLAAAEVGVAQRAIDFASAYAVERTAFKRPIAANQGVSFPLAEAHMRTVASRQTVLDLAARLDADPFDALGRAVTDVVSYAGESASETTRSALQTLGGHGYIVDYPVEIWYRAAAALASIDFDVRRSAFQPAV